MYSFRGARAKGFLTPSSRGREWVLAHILSETKGRKLASSLQPATSPERRNESLVPFHPKQYHFFQKKALTYIKFSVL